MWYTVCKKLSEGEDFMDNEAAEERSASQDPVIGEEETVTETESVSAKHESFKAQGL